MEKMRKHTNAEVGIKDFIKGAEHINLKIDNKFKGSEFKNVVYLASFGNDDICALRKDGSINIINPDGQLVSEFKANAKGRTSSLSIDKDDNIYLMSVKEEIKKLKIRGKIMERPTPKGVSCIVFNKAGKKLREFELKGIITASGTKVVDDKLLVTDCKNGKLLIYSKQDGKKLSNIDGLRPCCGILDFSINDNKQILVANLGGFKVQGYDLKGEIKFAFGKRGLGLNDFIGCCNPVSVAYLSNGAIVTVEKTPTRIKIYSKDGAKQIEGVKELVKGCSYIPMTSDSKDCLYLASPSKGIVKCTPSN